MADRRPRKRQIAKSKGGRPSKFDPRMIEEARRLASFGATDEEMAAFWRVSVKTFYNWQKEQPEFLQALKEGKETPDNAVERSLLERATGSSHPAVKILQFEGEPVIVPYTERYPPDTTSMIFWLKNRRPDRWRDKVDVDQKHQLVGNDEKPVSILQSAREIAFALSVALRDPGAQASASDDTKTQSAGRIRGHNQRRKP